MNSFYTPFPGKELKELTALDLNTLSSVSEGWYVEYKREIPNSKSIAKSISAFANTYGGWLFFGVDEASKSDSVAASCPGVSKEKLDDALQTIRNSVAAHLNPTPYFEIQVVWGPNDEMQLKNDFCVVCVQVPQSTLAPHVHSSGVIYRRVSDGSEPKAENDRHQLELLWMRREKVSESYKQWIDRAPERTSDEADHPYLRLLLEADLYRAKGASWNLTIEEIRDILNDPDAGLLIPFESIYPSAVGTVARQTSSLLNHDAFGMTFIVGTGARCEIWLPINCFRALEPQLLRSRLGHYDHIQQFISILDLAKAKDVRVLDLTQVFFVLVAISNVYIRLLEKSGIEVSDVFAKAILGDIWRTIPYVDSKTMLDRITRNGLPLCLTRNAMVPGGRDVNSFLEIPLSDAFKEMGSPDFSVAFWLFEMVCTALGLQGVFSVKSAPEISALIKELIEAGRRTNRSKAPQASE